MDNWSVYMHTSPNDKRYVGITSRKPTERWRNGRGYQHNTYFTNAINKYGWDNFKHEIIAENLSEESAKNMEVELIAKYNLRNPNFGYNQTDGGDGTKGVQRFGDSNPFFGKHHTEETKKIMSDNHYDMNGNNNPFFGKHHSKETKDMLSKLKGTAVCQFDLDMNFINEYQSVKEATRNTGIYQSMIIGCCNRDTGYKTAGGYAWIYKEDLGSIDFDEYKDWLIHEKLPKKICRYSLDAKFIDTFDSIGEASRMTNINASNISLALSKIYKQAGGYLWCLYGEEENIKPYKNGCCQEVCQLSKNMELINVFDSLTEASKEIGVSVQAIKSACNSKSHISKGYIWLLKDDYDKGGKLCH